MSKTAMQDCLPADNAARVCFGCGADNAHGLQIKSYMEDGQAICRFTPREHHTAYPGIVNGGILATVIDCHGIWCAIGHHHDLARDCGSAALNEVQFVTAKLSVEYLAPAPMGRELLARAHVVESGERSTVVSVTVFADDKPVTRGRVVAVRVNP